MVSSMTDGQFHKALASLRDLPFREDYQAALFDLYTASNSAQRVELRAASQAGAIDSSKKAWRNPTDYTRSDLTREQRMRQRLLGMSIHDGGDDYRDDLMSIAHCYHNLAVLGVDADAVLEEVAELSGPKFAGLVREFVRRSPQAKSAEVWCLKIVETPDGPAFDRFL